MAYMKSKKRWGNPTTNKKFKKTKTEQRKIKENVVYMKRTLVGNPIFISGAGSWSATPYQFQIDQLSGFSELQAVFDSYRINAIKVNFTPWFTENDTANQPPAASFYGLPRVYTLKDYNGIPVGQLATEAQFLEYGNAVQIMEPGKPFSIYINKPGVEIASAGGVGTSPAVNERSPWLDTSNGTIPHNGCAIGMANAAGINNTFYYHVTATFYLQLKNAV